LIKYLFAARGRCSNRKERNMRQSY